MTQWLTVEEARAYLELPSVTYLNSYVEAGELAETRRGDSVVFSQEELDRWRSERNLFALDMRDYMKCLHFAVGSLYKYCSVAGCATSNSSELAKVVDSFMLQKLGETAFQKFMDKNFKIFIKFEFEFHEEVVSQEVKEIALPGKWLSVYNPPERLRLTVKTIEAGNSRLVVPESEVEHRRHHHLIDVYVMVRVELPPDHLFRVLGESSRLRLGVRREEATIPRFEYLEADFGIAAEEVLIPQLESIQAEIVGYTWLSELLEAGVQPGIPAQELQPSYYLPTGNLRRGDSEWRKLIELL